MAAVIAFCFRAFRGDDCRAADGKVTTVAVAPVSVDNVGSRRADAANEQHGSILDQDSVEAYQALVSSLETLKLSVAA